MTTTPTNTIDIKQLIKNYIKIDDQLSTINKQTKEIRKAKSELEDEIKEYMLINSISKVDIGSGSLRISKTKPYKKINKKIIMEILLDSLEDHNKANNIIEEIFNEEDINEVTKLERSKKRN